MAEATRGNIDEWVGRIQKTRDPKQLLQLLEQFRQLEWTDAERQKCSHTYMRVLDVILKSSADALRKPEEAPAGNDGPVWYEKM